MFRTIGLAKPSNILSRITSVPCLFNRTAYQSKSSIRSAHNFSPPNPNPWRFSPGGHPVQSNGTAITIWTLAAVGTIYTTAAVIENVNLEKETPKVISVFTRNQENTYDVRRKVHEMKYPPGVLYSPTRWPTVNQLGSLDGRLEFWRKLLPSEQVTYALMSMNAAVHALGTLAPAFWSNVFMHTPGSNKNFTLLTCVFGHGSFIHLGFNMYGLHSFMPTLGQDPTFNSSIAHITAFYLSTGVISSWVQAISAGLRPNSYPIPFLGASGALFALVGAFALQHPDAKFQIMFIPYSFAAQELLGAMMLFDLLGVFGAFKSIRLGHAAHLSGAILGSGYVYFGGEKRIWQPLCRGVYKRFGMSKWEKKV
ncbi:hypothetical protein SBOR_5081 [Sclerotinia borealis F-4128]|uniref:Peptidase S54 rhomboid domain-containing protein n=1 Tax=Sclerotinia borealis (strain F-4128) TaxID=1432307 RepID=W9CF58_SCLBF|nr:hypothetical protein SBOR_5081 [Sclerotinia borealis F-4128]